MTKKQQQRYDEMMMDYNLRGTLTPGIKSLIYTLACVEIEEEELQEFIDEHGTCYSAPSGFDKQRPQWQQLRDNRQRKTTIVKALESQRNQATEEDELEQFIGA